MQLQKGVFSITNVVFCMVVAYVTNKFDFAYIRIYFFQLVEPFQLYMFCLHNLYTWYNMIILLRNGDDTSK